MRHAHIALGIALLLVGAPRAQGQAADEDFRIQSWQGGILSTDFRLGLQSGAPGAKALGAVFSARHDAGPGSLFSNPALLGLGRGGLVLEGRGGLSNGFMDLGSEALVSASRIAEATDNFLDDFGFEGTSTPAYTSLSGVTAGQPGQLGALLIARELTPGIVLAGGYHRRGALALNFRMSGLETVLDAGRRSGAQTIDIDLLAQFDGAAGLSLDLDQVGLGAGFHLGTDDLGAWHFGASVMRRAGNASLSWSMQPELMIVLSGSQQYFYNDPDDPNLAPGESNALFWRAGAQYRGHAWGAKAGLRYATPGEWMVLSVGGTWLQDLVMRDPGAYATGHLPAYVNLAGSPDPEPHEDELLNVEDLNLAKPNLTLPTSDSLGIDLTFRQPGHITAGLDLGLGPHTLTANYVAYLSELSLEGTFGSRDGAPKTFRLGKALDYEIRAGLDFQFPTTLRGAQWLLLPVRLLFLDLDGLLFQAMGSAVRYSDPHFSLGGGLAFGDAITEGVERNVRPELQRWLDGSIPSGITMTRRYTLLDRLDIGVMVAGVPDLFLRTAVTYRVP